MIDLCTPGQPEATSHPPEVNEALTPPGETRRFGESEPSYAKPPVGSASDRILGEVSRVKL